VTVGALVCSAIVFQQQGQAYERRCAFFSDRAHHPHTVHAGRLNPPPIQPEDGELSEAFTRASNEARSAFGDGRMFIEKYVEEPRHIEIQVGRWPGGLAGASLVGCTSAHDLY
jgi:hypothetical protein